MAGDEKDPVMSELEERMIEAFSSAYPEVPDGRLKHMARNFVQIMHGVISIGRTVGGEGEVSHMDVVNGLVYSCIASSFLDEDVEAALDDRIASKLGECAARVADWLLGLEVLRDDPELYASFVRGAVALGATDWESRREDLSY